MCVSKKGGVHLSSSGADRLLSKNWRNPEISFEGTKQGTCISSSDFDVEFPKQNNCELAV